MAQFLLGFKALAEALEGQAGEPLEDEWGVSFTVLGDPRQLRIQFTTEGVMVWASWLNQAYFFKDLSLRTPHVSSMDSVDRMDSVDSMDNMGNTTALANAHRMCREPFCTSLAATECSECAAAYCEDHANEYGLRCSVCGMEMSGGE